MAAKRREADQAKFNVRMRESLRRQLEEAAKKRGVSMNALIVEGLEQMFREAQAGEDRDRMIRATTEAEIKQQFGGPEAFEYARALACMIRGLEAFTGKSWRTDLETNESVCVLVDVYFKKNGPPGAQAQIDQRGLPDMFIARLEPDQQAKAASEKKEE